jgi:hypothetical protein
MPEGAAQHNVCSYDKFLGIRGLNLMNSTDNTRFNLRSIHTECRLSAASGRCYTWVAHECRRA